MKINTNQQISEKETQGYIDYIENKYNRKLDSLDININGDFVDLSYEFEKVPFERIRRITSYLVSFKTVSYLTLLHTSRKELYRFSHKRPMLGLKTRISDSRNQINTLLLPSLLHPW